MLGLNVAECCCSLHLHPQFGARDVELYAPSAEDPELLRFNVRSFKPGVCRNIALFASPTARNSAFFLVAVHSASFPPSPLEA